MERDRELDLSCSDSFREIDRPRPDLLREIDLSRPDLLRDFDRKLLRLRGSLYGNRRRRPPQPVPKDREARGRPMHDGRR